MRSALAFLLAVGAAYAFSFAVDLLLGGLLGIYPSTAFLPVVTWSLISAIAVLAAYNLSRGAWWLAVPYLFFGLLAVLGGLVSAHRHDFGVAALMFLHAYIVWSNRVAPVAAA